MPSLTLLGQSLISGILTGGLYGLLALGLSLSWGLLRLVNLGHFALAFLGAYLTYQLGTVWHLDPWVSVLVIVPLFFVIGMGLHVVFVRFGVAEFTSLLVTFGVTVILESIIQWFWTADFRRYETAYASASTRIGPLFVPTLEFLACATAAVLALATWAWLRFTYVGKALRASAEDPAMAAAFGVNHRRQAFLVSGVSAAYAGVAGAYIALISTLAPTQIWAWVGVVFAVVIIGGLANPIGALLAGLLIGVSESLTMAVVTPAWAPLVSFSVLIVLLDRPAGTGVSGRPRGVAVGILAIGLALSALPMLELPAFYESFLYLVFSWIALATSWSILSGYAGYFSFGQGAFFGAGMYTTATLAAGFGVPFLATLPVAGIVAALLGTGIGAVVFRVKRLRGELFGLLTLAITFVLATIVLNTRIDGGPGVYLLGVPIPRLVASPAGTIYLLGLALAVATVLTAYRVSGSRLGLGLFAIHDDEDVAEVKGVPTFRYKLVAFALSAGIAGVAGGIHAVYVSYVTVGETFSITVPLYVVLMSILGGARHWLGPAVGATIITASLYAFTRGESAVIGRAVVAFALILVILLLPEGVVPAVLGRWRAWRPRRPESGTGASKAPAVGAATAPDEQLIAAKRPDPAALRCGDVWKAFGGIQALRGVSLSIECGEIVGLVGPNGSGKTTMINVISGHYAADRGRIALGDVVLSGRPAHEVAGLGIARTYQIPRPFAHLTVLENVALAATFGAGACGPHQARAEARGWLEFTGLGKRAAALPPELNLHERKFLELARALAGRPRVILLDEVLSGLNPSEIASAIRLIHGIRAAGTSILFVEHVMRAVLELSDRVVVLNEGEVIATGTPREAMRDPHVVRVYLGKAHAA